MFIAAIRTELTRHPELTDGSPVPNAWRALVTPAMMLVALVVMVAVPSSSYWPMLLLALDGPLVRLVLHLGNRRAT